MRGAQTAPRGWGWRTLGELGMRGHLKCLDSLLVFSAGETEPRWTFQIWVARVAIAGSVGGGGLAGGWGQAMERSRQIAAQDESSGSLHLPLSLLSVSVLPVTPCRIHSPRVRLFPKLTRGWGRGGGRVGAGCRRIRPRAYVLPRGHTMEPL